MAEVVGTPQQQRASRLATDERDTQEKSVAIGQNREVCTYDMSKANTRRTECVRRARSGLWGKGRGNAPFYPVIKMVEVNPRGTSQECSSCGATVKKDLSVRVHRCSCGYEADRDVNAAINILHRGLTIAGGNVPRMVGRMREKRADVGPVRPGTVRV